MKETASQRTKTSLVLSKIYVQITTHETLNISYEGFVFPITISDIVTLVMKFILSWLVLSRKPCIVSLLLEK